MQQQDSTQDSQLELQEDPPAPQPIALSMFSWNSVVESFFFDLPPLFAVLVVDLAVSVLRDDFLFVFDMITSVKVVDNPFQGRYTYDDIQE